jgi:hypothetical protein
MPSFKPNPLGCCHVQKGAKNRVVTDSNIATKVFIGQIAGGFHGQIVGPLGVIKEVSDVG